jgi:hypothetical protein
MENLESIVRELMHMYEVTDGPIRVEQMLQSPRQGMWDEVDVSKMSTDFIKVTARYSPRMSMARLLARNIAKSQWGRERGLGELADNEKHEELIRAFARMLVMPADMIARLQATSRTPYAVGAHFEVPEEEAALRLQELAAYAG